MADPSPVRAADGGLRRANRRADGFDGYVGCPHRHCPTAATCAASGDCFTLARLTPATRPEDRT